MTTTIENIYILGNLHIVCRVDVEQQPMAQELVLNMDSCFYDFCLGAPLHLNFLWKLDCYIYCFTVTGKVRMEL